MASRAQPRGITAGLDRQRVPVGNRMGDRIGEDGSPMDPATIRALKWAALNWATHCSFTLYSSSLPRQQNFVLPDSSRVDSVGPELEQKERQKLRRSSRKRKRVRPESVAMARGGESSAGNRITEKKVVPVVPQHPGDFEMLRSDLATMQCEELLYRNWDIQDTGILAEVHGKASATSLPGELHPGEAHALDLGALEPGHTTFRTASTDSSLARREIRIG